MKEIQEILKQKDEENEALRVQNKKFQESEIEMASKFEKSVVKVKDLEKESSEKRMEFMSQSHQQNKEYGKQLKAKDLEIKKMSMFAQQQLTGLDQNSQILMEENRVLKGE